MADPKLTIELVPRSAWFVNLRSELPSWAWSQVSRNCYMDAGYVCEICGGKGNAHPVECHEIWEYDDKNKVQTLKGLIALCPPCHRVKHIGLAIKNGHERSALSHLAKVNGWSYEQASDYCFRQFQVHNKRSKFKWTTDISWINTLFPVPVIAP